MRKTVLNKLKSNKGATLSFALLLFLICTIASVIILSAASASAGRIANLTEYDSRYYSVHSGAMLLKEELDGQTYVNVRKKTTTDTTVTEFESSDTITSKSSITTDQKISYNYQITYGSQPITSESVLSEASEYLFYGGDAVSTSGAAFDVDCPASFPTITRNYTLTHADTDSISAAALELNVTETLSTDGNLKFVVSNASSDPADIYSITLTFQPSIKKTETAKTETKAPEVSATLMTETAITTETKTTEVVWNFIGID